MRYTLRHAQFWKISWFPFVQHGMKKRNKTHLIFRFTYGMISNFIPVCVLIILSPGCNLIMWYELNKKLCNILLLFQYCPMRVQPSWQSQVRWLAKFKCDVTWNTPIMMVVFYNRVFCYILKSLKIVFTTFVSLLSSGNSLLPDGILLSSLLKIISFNMLKIVSYIYSAIYWRWYRI